MGTGSSRLNEPPEAFYEAGKRYQQNPRDPQQPDELLRKLKGLLERRNGVKGNKQHLEKALQAGEKLEKHLAGLQYESQSMKDKKNPVVVVWDKDKMQDTYRSVLHQLLEATHCREIRPEDFNIDKKRKTPALYICRTSTGRLEDIDKDKFDELHDPKALVVLRSGNNEQAFPASYNAGDVASNATLVVQLLHYQGNLIRGKWNDSGLEKIKKFVWS